MIRRVRAVCAALLVIVCGEATAQFGFRSAPREDLVQRFDGNGDGRVEGAERIAARVYARSRPGYRPTDGQGSTRATTVSQDLRSSARTAAPPDAPLYDMDTLRTLYLRFDTTDWYEELADFYGSGVEIPADLIVDGVLYPGVGVHFRGNSSYMTTGSSPKKSFGISVDYRLPDQRLAGYRTLNLLNAHTDPSFVREALYYRVAREYVPAPQANFVRLVVNGESWGVYVNVQQINKDFLREWYGSADGVRWKVPAGRGGGASLAYRGEDPSAYRSGYQLETQDQDDAWDSLVGMLAVLDRSPTMRDLSELQAVLDVDEVIWYLALENVFTDSDGYLSRGSDFLMYQDASGRFHLLPHDNNETFRFVGGGGPNSWPTRDPMLSPTAFEGSDARPLVRALLAFPELRARYLAHLGTIVREHLDWEVLGPLVQRYHALIDADVRADDKKLYTYEAFRGSVGDGAGLAYGPGGSAPGLEDYVRRRRAYLLGHPELQALPPSLRALKTATPPRAGSPMPVTVEARAPSPGASLAVRLYYATTPHEPYRSQLMSGEPGGTYRASIPAAPAGTTVRYYVEALTGTNRLVAAYEPERAESAPATYTVPAVRAASTTIVINELMASNNGAIRDPQGQADDWIELKNLGDRAMDVGGMYLSDREEDPRKSRIPPSTIVPPGGHLLIWADEDTQDTPGLHASFKLSASGETLMLVDTDERGNQILDIVLYGVQQRNVSLGRRPDGSGTFVPTVPTPGAGNR